MTYHRYLSASRGAIWAVPGLGLLAFGTVGIAEGRLAATFLIICGSGLVCVGVLRWSTSRHSPDAPSGDAGADGSMKSRKAKMLVIGFVTGLGAIAVLAGILYEPHASGSSMLVHVMVAAATLSLLCFVLAPLAGLAGALRDSRRRRSHER